MEEFKFDWFTKLLLKFWPTLAMRRLAKDMGIENLIFDKAHEVFSEIQHIDLLPLRGGHRGFMIILDRKTALYFYQDGNHFKYDGYEMGEYDRGDVTIFDNLRK